MMITTALTTARSSATSVLRSATSASVRSFTVSSIDLSRREVLVELTADIDGLGFARDRVLVTPGRARNQLIPGGVARFVPWKRPSDKEPRIAERVDTTATTSTTTSAPLEVVTRALASLPNSITFPHRATSPTSRSIFGSVTLADVSRKLEEQHGVPAAGVQYSWIGLEESARLKELGKWNLEIRAIKRAEEVVPPISGEGVGAEGQAQLGVNGPSRATITVEVIRA